MYTILIVDDDRGMLRILQLIFERAKYRVLIAASAEDALTIIHRQPVDVVLLDDMMPGMNGTEMCYLLKHDPLTSMISIIIHSAGHDVINQQLMREIRADGALRKPCEPQVLLEAVARCAGVKV